MLRAPERTHVRWAAVRRADLELLVTAAPTEHSRVAKPFDIHAVIVKLGNATLNLGYRLMGQASRMESVAVLDMI